ncbi:hypothetical protein Rcae01_00002 [Novipirellula caenicola]|uniref:Carboxypeptidase regulatory-like domain-containing protein n=1 Tax=Novipirellula caenicola TaxID=1536901 RepID=A0ABP9VMD5_9BACT
MPLRFSIRTLFAIVTVAALIAVCFVHLQRTAAKRRLAKRIEFHRDIVNAQSGVDGPSLLRVVSADDGRPVRNVIVGLTRIGPDGGDGGFKTFLTDSDGVARRHIPLQPGRYQWHLSPSVDSRYIQTYWRPGMPYISVAADGTTSVPTLVLQSGVDE